LRGNLGRDEEVHKALSWAIRKDKKIRVRIALEIGDPVGDESHEIRYWEITRDPPIVATANALYGWLAGRLIIRSQPSLLSKGMPATGEATTVQVQRKSEGAFILFTVEGNCARDMDSSPNICKIEYEEGYLTFGMPERYTMRMLFSEFGALTPDWRLLPTPSYKIGSSMKPWLRGRRKMI
jgi:hypothetical protein